MLIELGRLVSIRYEPKDGRPKTLSWPFRSAPILAYDKREKITLVYAAEARGRSTAKERAEYERSHWGQRSRGARLIGRTFRGSAKRLGVALRITYATKKGTDRELVNYVHEFGEGGSGRLVRPTLHEARVRGVTMVRLTGGSYVVNNRGIVG